jgi:ATP-dependent DNA ligase
VVRHASTKKLVYMVFDVLHWNGQALADKKLEERLPKISNLVGFFRDRQVKYPDETLPFTIIGKKFFDKSQLLGLRALVHQVGHERFYADENKKRHHLTDGFIFTPNEPYHPKGTDNLFKWKYIDLVCAAVLLSPESCH